MKKSHKPIYRTGIGQDSHRFLSPDTAKPCVLGGVIFENTPGFQANSDGDVLLHALCNAISSLTGIPILGKIADELCLKDGITDSRAYVREALKTLEGQIIIHAAFTIEGKRPRLLEKIPQMQKNIALILEINPKQVGITATTGEGLTDFGCGDGMQCFCILTTVEE